MRKTILGLIISIVAFVCMSVFVSSPNFADQVSYAATGKPLDGEMSLVKYLKFLEFKTLWLDMSFIVFAAIALSRFKKEMIVPILYIVVHWLFYPEIWNRFFVAPYLLIAVVAIKECEDCQK